MDCVICYGRIKNKKCWCCPACNNKLHSTCYNKWCIYSDACPYCRYSPKDENKGCGKICCCVLIIGLFGQIFGTTETAN